MLSAKKLSQLPRRDTWDATQIFVDTVLLILLVLFWPITSGYKALVNDPGIRYDRATILYLSLMGVGVAAITLWLSNLWNTGVRSGWWVVAFVVIYAVISALRTILHIFGYEGDDWNE